jgi:hypothetical protein
MTASDLCSLRRKLLPVGGPSTREAPLILRTSMFMHDGMVIVVLYVPTARFEPFARNPHRVLTKGAVKRKWTAPRKCEIGCGYRSDEYEQYEKANHHGPVHIMERF